MAKKTEVRLTAEESCRLAAGTLGPHCFTCGRECKNEGTCINDHHFRWIPSPYMKAGGCPQPEEGEKTVPAEHFMQTIAVNVNNKKLTDKAFRQFIRNSLPIVIFERI